MSVPTHPITTDVLRKGCRGDMRSLPACDLAHANFSRKSFGKTEVFQKRFF